MTHDVDYIAAPFTHEWGTRGWVDEAIRRAKRAEHEFTAAATRLLAASSVSDALAARGEIAPAADNVCRCKWMMREAADMLARLPPEPLRIMSQDGLIYFDVPPEVSAALTAMTKEKP